MAVPRWSRASCVGSFAVALLFLLSGPLVAPTGAHAGGTSAPLGAGCLGASLDSSYSGALTFEGGPLPASDLANVSLQFTYAYETTVLNDTGAIVSVSCTSVTHDVTTGPEGAFGIQLTVPSDGCDRETGECSVVSGPFGPLQVGPALAPPAGYQPSTTVTGDSVSVALVAELASVGLDPGGPVEAYSPTATETVVAEPLTGNGSASLGTPEYTWSLSGAGWRFVGAPNGSSVTLTSADGAGLGDLSVRAHLTVGNTTFAAGPTNLSLEAVATSILATNENRSELDVGGSVAVSLTASGAPGYPYTAVALPGLGLSAAPLTCSSESNGPTAELLTCSADLAYPDPGVGAPEVVVSDGYSTATATLAPITVDPAPALEVVPSAPLGYAGQPITVRVSALSGTGTSPYQGACLDPGNGTTLCASTPGPSWTFRPTYASAGTYRAAVWAEDASGTNSSLGVTVGVAAPLALASIAVASGPVLGGETVNFSANLTGGFLPGRFWWNVSDVPGSVATGTARSDGPLELTWVPPAAGSVLLSLTVVDGLGTPVERSTVVSVGADPAFSVTAVVLPPPDPVRAGGPVELTWAAFDSAGAPAVTFASSAEISVSGPNGIAPPTAWVNASGVGPLPSSAPGAFQVPTAAWDQGRLNLSVAIPDAQAWTLRLGGLSGLTAPPPLTVYVGPDLAHLHLFDPEVVVPGERTNRTLWHIEDEFGNPAWGTAVDVDLSSGSFSEEAVVPVLAEANGTAGVWVNFSAPGPGRGSLEVLTPLGGLLLGPLSIPAAPTGSLGAGLAAWWVLGLSVGGAALVGVIGAVRRRRAGRGGELSEEELHHFVEGRDRVIAAVERAGVADLALIEAAWTGTSPPAEIPDWVASLVADGTLGARTGPDGVARFCLAGPALGPAHILLDEEALAAATRAREELTHEPEAERPDPEGSR